MYVKHLSLVTFYLFLSGSESRFWSYTLGENCEGPNMEAIKKQATKLREQVAKQQQVWLLCTLLIYVVLYLFFFKYLVGEVTSYKFFFFLD